MTRKDTPTVELEHVPIDKLRPDPMNPRMDSEATREAATRSVNEFGMIAPIIVRREDWTIIDGHHRVVAARRLGHKTVPVVFVDLPVERARTLGLALNNISGEWDPELLARLVAELDAFDGIDLGVAGFHPSEIQELVRSVDARERRERVETFDVDGAIEEATRPTARSQPGDVWSLGGHRIICGDSTDGGTIERLLGTVRPAMAFTDPPYNVAYGDHGGQQQGATRRRIANDELAPEEWEAFCTGWAQQLVDHVDGALYVCMSTKEWPLISRLLEEVGAHWSDTIIWSKDRFTLGRADYQRQYEPIWYGWREGSTHHWCGDRNQGDLWEIPRPSVSPLHPTMKPLELVERALENSSTAGDGVLDLFLGSGTTLIAAERTGRTCYGVELDPHYVDVAIARWEAFTGEQAEKQIEVEHA